VSRRITILCDNTVGPMSGTLGEHGFAALVEGEGDPLLFDTGQGETLLYNAQRLNRDLHRVGRVVLSHGHWDHTGGLRALLSSCGPKEILAHPGVFARRYRVRENGSVAVGIPYSEDFLAGIGARYDFSTGFREVAPGIFLTGEVPRTAPFEKGDAGLCCDDAGCRPDLLPDDQSLAAVTPRGLVILVGCCHAGVINTIRYCIEKTGIPEIRAVIGGTHLSFCSHEQLEETVRGLRELRVHKIYGSHCTGFPASARLSREFPGHFHPAAVGFTLEI
jgi:7,8-dihydropterin-6-yl-methyl-4-(beta-D-ribofuranosyl)aminobenzene 5'-phosphate synthase